MPEAPEAGPRRRWRCAVAAVAAVVVWWAGPPESLASFGDAAQATGAFSADVLAPPTSVTATAGCELLSAKVTVTWTPSTSTWADGQEVGRSATAGGTLTIVASGLATTATSHKVTGLAVNTTYWFEVRSTRNEWRGRSARVSATTPLLCVL